MDKKDIYSELADFGRELLEKKSFSEGLPYIVSYSKKVMKAQRCSVYIYEEENDKLWTTHSDGVKKIVVPSGKGVVGYTLRVRKPIIVNDPYSNPHFLPDVDKKTGYKTQNMITAPIFNSNREVIGVLQLLNKTDGDFNDDDKRFIIFFAHYISGFIELVVTYKT
ncbi:MAG: GAF domain-containing protein [Campylobacterota bacterium]|nr:GAF domain-containing protein [Campylobacterota bacterium]